MKEKITLIGFGEAGQHIAQGLAEEGADVRVYDMRLTGKEDDPLAKKAAELGVTACACLQRAVEGASFVFSLVVGAAAVPVGRDVAAYLLPEQIFIDLNSVSPATKKAVAVEVEAKGKQGVFVEGAVMARVPPYRHKVPVLLAGARAAEAVRRLSALGMQVEAVGDVPGQASANKMLRSVVVKGIEALLLECLMAAKQAGVEERILDSLGETFPGMDWREVASYYLSRTALHGARRVTEMTEAAGTVKEFGVDPLMSLAAAERIGKAHEHFRTHASGPEEAADYRKILQVLAR